MSLSISLRTRSLGFYESLLAALPARTVSDRTCYRRIAAWLIEQVEAGRFDEDIFPVVLSYATEAAEAPVRNPRAVFVSILKKELGYEPRVHHRADA